LSQGNITAQISCSSSHVLSRIKWFNDLNFLIIFQYTVHCNVDHFSIYIAMLISLPGEDWWIASPVSPYALFAKTSCKSYVNAQAMALEERMLTVLGVKV
jgi:hypothetical protein